MDEKKRSKNRVIFIIIISFILIFIGIITSIGIFDEEISFFGIEPFNKQNVSSYNLDSEYIEILVKTSDNKGTNNPVEERKGNAKQGYVINARPEGWNWGDLELDPKAFAIIKIPASEWNESWLEPEYNYSAPIYEDCERSCLNDTYCSVNGEIVTREECEKNPEFKGYEILTERKYRIPLENFLNSSELSELKNIPYNDNTYRPPIIKNITNISSLIEEVDWENRPADMKLHGSSGVFTICDGASPNPCNYTSLSAWESAQDSNLTGTGPCIANITEGFEDNVNLVITGWETTAVDYIQIITTPEARHQGKWNDTAYFINSSGSHGIGIHENFVRVEGLQINAPTAKNGVYFSLIDVISDIRMDKCIIRGEYDVSNDLIYVNDDDTIFRISNSLVYGAGSETGDYGIIGDGAAVFIYSTTIAEVGVGIRGTNRFVKNTLINNCTWTRCVFEAVSCENVATDDASSSGCTTSSDFRDNQVFQFEDQANHDYHLSLLDENATDYGMDLSSDPNMSFNDDIDGETRTGTWDIGADEYVSGVSDDESPQFSSYWDNNATLINSGTAWFNVTLSHFNGTVFLEIDETNYSAHNLTATIFNTTASLTDGTYPYYWGAWGNGTDENYNTSEVRYYTVNASADTCSPTSPLTANYQFECSDYCNISSNLNAGGFNITINGTGYFNLYANISNINDLFTFGESSEKKCNIYCFGGCFI